MSNVVFNRVWGLPIAVEMTLLAVASFAAVWAYYFWRRGDRTAALAGGVVAALLPLGAIAILLVDLLKPLSAIMVLPVVNPRANLGSWMVWGGLAIGGLAGVSTLFVLATWRNVAGAGWLGLVAAGLGLAVSIYPGQMLANARGIAFWQSPVVPLIAVLMGLVGGTAVFALLMRRVERPLAFGASALAVVFGLHLYLSAGGPRAPAASAIAATRDLGLALGLVFVLAAAALALASGRRRWLAPPAGLAAIAAVFALRLVLLEAGAWELGPPL